MNVYEKLRKSENKIVIFGAGFTGRYILEKCRNENINITAFVDNAAPQMAQVDSLVVISLDEAVKEYGEKMSFIISIQDIRQTLWQIRNKGIYEYITADKFYNLTELANRPFPERQKLENTWYIHTHHGKQDELHLDTLDLVVTERCSLRCRECSNLMQYYERPKHYPVAELKNMLKRITDIYDEVYEVRILGGEPFVYPELLPLLKYIQALPSIKRVCIYTNGTILPNEENLSLMKDMDKVWLSISDYGVLSRKLQDLTQALDRSGINYIVKKIDWWTKCASFEFHQRTPEEATQIYYECCAKNLVTLLDGVLYPCPYIAHAINLQAVPFQEGNAVDLRDNSNIADLKREIRHILKGKDSFSLCSYCPGRPYKNLTESDKIPPHEQTMSPLTYRKYSYGE